MDNGNNVFDVLTSHATGERLDRILSGDGAYLEARKEIEDVSVQMKEQGFSEEEIQMIDGLVCAYISQGICCMRIAYQQGFKDCACLLFVPGGCFGAEVGIFCLQEIKEPLENQAALVYNLIRK